MRFLEAALAWSLGRARVRIESYSNLSGGSTREAQRLVTSEGDFFAKWSNEGPEDIFVCEAHGLDWAGNVLSSLRGPALVDPTCAYTDREMEFGITTLFRGLSARAFAAYEEAWA